MISQPQAQSEMDQQPRSIQTSNTISVSSRQAHTHTPNGAHPEQPLFHPCARYTDSPGRKHQRRLEVTLDSWGGSPVDGSISLTGVSSVLTRD